MQDIFITFLKIEIIIFNKIFKPIKKIDYTKNNFSINVNSKNQKKDDLQGVGDFPKINSFKLNNRKATISRCGKRVFSRKAQFTSTRFVQCHGNNRGWKWEFRNFEIFQLTWLHEHWFCFYKIQCLYLATYDKTLPACIFDGKVILRSEKVLNFYDIFSVIFCISYCMFILLFFFFLNQ